MNDVEILCKLIEIPSQIGIDNEKEISIFLKKMLQKNGFEIEEYEFEKGVGKYVSFIPFSGAVKGITLKGFRYNVEKFTLNPGSTRCVSNEVSEKKAAIHIDEGCLIAVIASDVKSE